MKKLLALLLLLPSFAFAQTGSVKTQAQLNAEIGANSCAIPGCLLPDQLLGQITPFGIRQGLLDITSTMFAGVRQKLTAPQTYYVRTDGNNNNTGLVNSAAGAWSTIQYAMNYVCTNLDLNAQRVTIQLGIAGTYDAHSQCTFTGNFNAGQTSPVVVGDVANQGSYVITSTSGNAVVGVSVPTPWTYQGVKFTTTGGGSNCLEADINTLIYLDQVQVGPCVAVGINPLYEGKIEAISYNGSATGTKISFVGNAAAAFLAANGGQFLIQPNNTIAQVGTPAFTTYAQVQTGGNIFLDSTTFSGAATGTRWSVDETSFITFNGRASAQLNGLPGNANGSFTGLPIERGGTNSPTAGAARTNLGIAGRGTKGDTSYNMVASDCPELQLTAPLTAPRTWSLPVSTTMQAGDICSIVDPQVLGATNPLTVNTQAETLYGVGVSGGGIVLSVAGASVSFRTDGAGGWYLVSATQAVAVQSITTQQFSTSANSTYTPNANLLFALVECTGQGGGGGGAAASATGDSSGGGGGAGSYSRVRLTAAQIGASKAVTNTAAANAGATGNNAGTAGNDTSLGTLCVGKGGSGGGGAAANSCGTAGVGGVAGTGDTTIVGNSGGRGMCASITTVSAPSGAGGSGPWGGGAPGVDATAGILNGIAGTACGSGGSGGQSEASASTAAGGAGGNGCVFITEFNSK